MRLLFIVLVLLNVLALASARGWLGTPATRGEPERLSNQLNPDRIVLQAPEEPGRAAADAPAAPVPALPAPAEPVAEVPPAVADVPAAAEPVEPLACVAYAGLAEAQAEALVATAMSAQPEVRIDRSTTNTPTAWWVRIPPSGGREGAERRIEGLRALGVNEYFLVQEPGPNQYAVSLGLFKTEAKAQQHFNFLRNKGVRDAEVAPRSAAVHKIEFRGPAAALAALGKSAAAARSGATRSECTP